MSRSVLIAGGALVLIALSIFCWKLWVLDLPLAPTGGEGLWRVELEVSARGSSRRGSIRVPLPSSGPGQAVFDERSQSDRLLFTIRTEDEQRIGVWSGRQVARGMWLVVSRSCSPHTTCHLPLEIGDGNERFVARGSRLDSVMRRGWLCAVARVGEFCTRRRTFASANCGQRKRVGCRKSFSWKSVRVIAGPGRSGVLLEKFGFRAKAKVATCWRGG